MYVFLHCMHVSFSFFGFSFLTCMLPFRFLASLSVLCSCMFSYMHVSFSFSVLDEVWLLFWCCFHASFLTFMLPYVFQKLHVSLSSLSVPATFVVLFWCNFHVCFLTCMLAFHFYVSDEVWLLY